MDNLEFYEIGEMKKLKTLITKYPKGEKQILPTVKTIVEILPAGSI